MQNFIIVNQLFYLNSLENFIKLNHHFIFLNELIYSLLNGRLMYFGNFIEINNHCIILSEFTLLEDYHERHLYLPVRLSLSQLKSEQHWRKKIQYFKCKLHVE